MKFADVHNRPRNRLRCDGGTLTYHHLKIKAKGLCIIDAYVCILYTTSIKGIEDTGTLASSTWTLSRLFWVTVCREMSCSATVCVSESFNNAALVSVRVYSAPCWNYYLLQQILCVLQFIWTLFAITYSYWVACILVLLFITMHLY